MKWSYTESVCEDRHGNKTYGIDILDEDGCVITSLECEEEFGEEELSEFRKEAVMITLAPQLYEFVQGLTKPNFSRNVLDIAQQAREALEISKFERVE